MVKVIFLSHDILNARKMRGRKKILRKTLLHKYNYATESDIIKFVVLVVETDELFSFLTSFIMKIFFFLNQHNTQVQVILIQYLKIVVFPKNVI